MERRNSHFCQAPCARKSQTSAPPSPALRGISLHQPMDGLVDPCRVASLRSQPPRPGLRPSHQCPRECGRGPRPTPRAQPPPSPSWTWPSPLQAGATGIEMANPFRPHAWRLPSKTTQRPETFAVQKGAKKIFDLLIYLPINTYVPI